MSKQQTEATTTTPATHATIDAQSAKPAMTRAQRTEYNALRKRGDAGFHNVFEFDDSTAASEVAKALNAARDVHVGETTGQFVLINALVNHANAFGTMPTGANRSTFETALRELAREGVTFAIPRQTVIEGKMAAVVVKDRSIPLELKGATVTRPVLETLGMHLNPRLIDDIEELQALKRKAKDRTLPRGLRMVAEDTVPETLKHINNQLQVLRNALRVVLPLKSPHIDQVLISANAKRATFDVDRFVVEGEDGKLVDINTDGDAYKRMTIAQLGRFAQWAAGDRAVPWGAEQPKKKGADKPKARTILGADKLEEAVSDTIGAIGGPDGDRKMSDTERLALQKIAASVLGQLFPTADDRAFDEQAVSKWAANEGQSVNAPEDEPETADA